MSVEPDTALEKVLTANLARITEWLRYAETKNAALLTFCSAWVIATFTFGYNGRESSLATVIASVGLPFFLVGAGLSLWSFAPKTDLKTFFRRAEAPRAETPIVEPNLLYFGDLARLSLEEGPAALAAAYRPGADRGLTDRFVRDIGVQIIVNSQIARAKFNLADWSVRAIIGGMGAMVLVPVVAVGLAWWGPK